MGLFSLFYRIHCSQTCRDKLNHIGGYHLEERGMTNVKVKISFF